MIGAQHRFEAGWNAELVQGDVVEAVRRPKERPGRGISLGGVRLPATLAAHGLFVESTFIVHPVVAGRGPRLLDGVGDQVGLHLVERRELASGISVQPYRPIKCD